jgi:lipopolysaccharide/colanic/teichoic acid biosynthesis glycosyltransferase
MTTGKPVPRSTVLFDLTFASVCLAWLALPMLLIAIAIIIESGRPVFFSQTRIGQHGRRFRLHKFRKFYDGDAAGGCALTVQNDPRLTRVGWFLERSKLDELPQLWNVLKGEMSVVGPRPETPHFESCFSHSYSRVLDHRPGIVGPAQVMFRNESALYTPGEDPEIVYRAVLFPAKARIDLAYYPERTLIGDLKWVLLAVLAVCGWRGFPQIDRNTTGELGRVDG